MPTEMCEDVHPKNRKDQFCNKCAVAVCSDCAHKDHLGHFIETIASAKERRHATSRAFISYRESVKSIEESVRKLQQEMSTLESEMNQIGTSLNNYLVSSIYDSELKNMRDDFERAMENQREQLEKFHNMAKKEVIEKITSAKDARTKVHDQRK